MREVTDHRRLGEILETDDENIAPLRRCCGSDLPGKRAAAGKYAKSCITHRQFRLIRE